MKQTGVAILAATVLLSSGSGAWPAEEPFAIPVVLSLTGSFAFAGQSGRRSLVALQDAVNRDGGIKGRPVRFDFSDDQSNPQVAVQVTQVALEASPAVIIGSELTAPCLAMEPITRGKAVQFCISPGVHPAYGSYLFSASISTDGYVAAMLRYMRERNWKRLAMIVSTDASGQDGESRIKLGVTQPENAGGVQIVADEQFTPTDQSVAAQMQKIRASNPDAIMMWSSGTPFGTIVRAYADSGMDLPVFSPASNMNHTFLKQFAAFLPKDLYFTALPYLATVGPSPLPRAQRAAIQRYYDAMKRANIAVEYVSGSTWDPGLILIDALRRLGTNAGAAQLRTYLLGLRKYVGISGIYDFSDGPGAQRGLTAKDAIVVRWQPAADAWAAVSKPGGSAL